MPRFAPPLSLPQQPTTARPLPVFAYVGQEVVWGSKTALIRRPGRSRIPRSWGSRPVPETGTKTGMCVGAVVVVGGEGGGGVIHIYVRSEENAFLINLDYLVSLVPD